MLGAATKVLVAYDLQSWPWGADAFRSTRLVGKTQAASSYHPPWEAWIKETVFV